MAAASRCRTPVHGETRCKLSRRPVQSCNYETVDGKAREQLHELSTSKRLWSGTRRECLVYEVTDVRRMFSFGHSSPAAGSAVRLLGFGGSFACAPPADGRSCSPVALWGFARHITGRQSDPRRPDREGARACCSAGGRWGGQNSG